MSRAPRIRIKRVYEPAAKSDGKRVLVDRVWPRGLRKDEAAIDEWLKDVAPSAELRKWFGHSTERWDEFRRRYETELSESPDAFERLAEWSREGTLTLLFAARDERHNNAVVLKELLEKRR